MLHTRLIAGRSGGEVPTGAASALDDLVRSYVRVGDGPQSPSVTWRHVRAAALAALAADPIATGRILSLCGSWQLLLFEGSLTDGPCSPTVRVAGELFAGRVELATKLQWLREASTHGALSLSEASTTPPEVWVLLLRAIEPSSCVDACTLLTLALLPPPPCSSPAAALGTQLEPFLGHWLLFGWPRPPLLSTLRVCMLEASLGLCWLLEHRPALMSALAMPAEILLDAVRIVARGAPSSLSKPRLVPSTALV